MIPTRAPDLVGDLVTLGQLDQTVFDDYWKLLHDAEVARWTGPAQAFTREQITQWLVSRPEQNDRLDWAIFEGVGRRFVGEIVLNEFDSSAKAMNLRIALGSEFHGQGFGTEAVQLVCGWGLGELGLRKITLGVMADNLRAQRAYEKSGFMPVDTYLEDGVNYIAMETTKKTSHF